MDQIIKKQRKALEELAKRLKEMRIAAEPAGDEQEALSLLLSGVTDRQEVFADIAFMPQREEMDGISYCILQSELLNLEGLKGEEAGNVCIGLASVNSTLLGGGYSLEITENDDDTVSVGRLLYRYILPLVPEYDGEHLVQTLLQAILLVSSDLKSTFPALLSYIRGEVSPEEFFKEMYE